MPVAIGEMKLCTKCGKTKNISEFHKDKRTRDGLKVWCIECRYTKKGYQYKYHLTRKDNEKEYMRNFHLQRAYGISIIDWDKLFHEQEGTCAICNEEFTDKINVDHNHQTGKIRGLLCDKCNRALGQFNDSIEKLKNAIEYLEKYSGG